MARLEEHIVRTRESPPRVVRVRSAVPEDAPRITAYDLAIAHEPVHLIYLPEEVVADADKLAGKLARAMERDDELRLIALAHDGASGEADGLRVVGEVSLRAHPARRMAHVAKLGLGVAAGWRGVGLGGALLDIALNWGRAHPRIELIELGVMGTNTSAQALYRSRGFVEWGRAPGYFRMGEGWIEDDITMGLVLARSGPEQTPRISR